MSVTAKPHNQPLLQAIAQMRLAGLTFTAIAAKLGITKNRVAGLVFRYNLNPTVPVATRQPSHPLDITRRREIRHANV